MAVEVQIAHSIHELDPLEWEGFGDGRAFQSYCWYEFGEKVMGDCPPTYLIVRDGERIVGRATFWLVHNEPLRLPPGLRAGFRFIFRRRPLLICRSPLADTSSLILPDGPERDEVRALLIATARQELRSQRGSFLIFDFLNSGLSNWPTDFNLLTMASPGTHMELQWPDFESYLAQRQHRSRRHYKKSLEEAQKMGLRLTRHPTVENPHAVKVLIENVFRKHGAPLNPWMLSFLENLQMVDSTWMEVHQGEELVGCVAALRDRGVQLGTALGLKRDISYAYFLLIYAVLQEAFDHHIQTLRLGSGAYEFKRRLGFSLEDNNHLRVAGTGPVSNWMMRLAAAGS